MANAASHFHYHQSRSTARLDSVLLMLLLLLFLMAFADAFSSIGISSALRNDTLSTQGRLYNYSRLSLAILVIGASFLIGARHRRHRFIVLLIFPCFALSSLAWTVDLYTTFYFAAFPFIFFFTVAFAFSKLSNKQIFDVLFIFSSAIMGLSVLFAIGLPDFGRHSELDVSQSVHAGLWRGIFGHKNILGGASAIALLIGLGRWSIGKAGISLFGIAPSVLCLAFSQSATAFVGASAGIAMLFIASRHTNRARRTLTLLLVFAAFTMVAAYPVVIAYLAEVTGREANFTGRDEIWDVVIQEWAASPIVGYGYGAGTISLVGQMLQDVLGLAAVDSHSGYLDLLVGVGILGLIAFMIAPVLAIYAGFSALKRAQGDDRAVLSTLISVLVCSMTLAVTEVGPFRSTGPTGVMFYFCVAALITFQTNSKPTPQRHQ